MSEKTDRERAIAKVDAVLEQARGFVETLEALRTELQGSSATEPPAEFCRMFADIVGKYVRRPRVTATWEIEARRLFELDRVTFEQAQQVLAWLATHDGREASFWRRNVLSVPTFRKQWDRLVLAMRQDAETLKAQGNGRAERLLAMSRSMPTSRRALPKGGR